MSWYKTTFKKFWWFRIGLFYLILIPATAFFALIGSLAKLFYIPLSIRYWFVQPWAYFFIYPAKWILGVNFQILGQENLPKSPYIVFSNHQSSWETCFTTFFFPIQSWIMKKEILSIPFFGWGIASLEPISIDRKKKSSSLDQILTQGTKALQNQKRCVIVYPQGTRVPYGQKKNYSKGAAKLALKANVPIVPMAHNAGRLWPRGFFPKQAGTITVSFGKPIYPENQNAAEITQSASSWIESEIVTIQHVILP